MTLLKCVTPAFFVAVIIQTSRFDFVLRRFLFVVRFARASGDLLYLAHFSEAGEMSVELTSGSRF